MKTKPTKTTKKTKPAANWFDVDKEGLAEMHANFPGERMVMELFQNVWDTNATKCTGTLQQLGKETLLTVEDDHPDGFANIRDAYTLFGTTSKRGDPTKRGRFNYGEKIVLARAKTAVIITTKGSVVFDNTGRHNLAAKRKSGSKISIYFDRWSDKDFKQAVAFLKRLRPPQNVVTTLNGEVIPHEEPLVIHKTTLQTEFTKPVEGATVMVKTKRATALHIHNRAGDVAYLYEMGMPVCEISGIYDVDVQQKIPLSQDRTVVPMGFIQDIYAEVLNAMHQEMPADAMEKSSMKLAMEDDRMTPDTTKAVFERLVGTNAVIQSHSADSDQEAARQGVTLVPSRMFGSEVNSKLRDAGVQTSMQRFSRDVAVRELEGLMPGDFKPLNTGDPAHQNFLGYAKMLAEQVYGAFDFKVQLAQWTGTDVQGLNRGRNHVMFNVNMMSRRDMEAPVTNYTSLILHELAHCQGEGHDGVYDREMERCVNTAFALQAKSPELFQKFEPQLFGAG